MRNLKRWMLGLLLLTSLLASSGCYCADWRWIWDGDDDDECGGQGQGVHYHYHLFR